MKSIEILSLQNHLLWNEYLQNLPIEQQDIYFTPEYYSLYENYGDGNAKCFVYKDGDSLAIYPFLINEVNSLGFKLNEKYYDIQGAYGYNGVIASDYSTEFIESFYKEFNNYCLQNNIIAEFTRFHPLLDNYKFSLSNLSVIFDRLTVYINLNNEYNKIFKNFQSTTKLQIKRAINRYGLKCIILNEADEYLDEFIEVYYDSLNRIKSEKYLYFNIDYFKSLFKLDNLYLLIAIYDDKPISVISVLKYGNYLHGHLGGTLSEYTYLSPFSFLYSEMIKLAIDMNCKLLHVGGGATNNDDDKLLNYKKHFSKDFKKFHIGKKIHNKEIYEEVINQWKNKYPYLIEKHDKMILKYRLINEKN